MPVTSPPKPNDDDGIAVVGLACRFPGADDPEALLQGLIEGACAVGPIPSDRWPVAAHHDPDPRAAGGIYTDRIAAIEGVDLFDRRLFGLSATEARMADPQHRLLLEVAWQALESAGIAPARLRGSDTGVYVGISSVDYWLLQARAGFPAAASPYAATGGAPSVAAGRLSYCLGLNGPALAVDTACSSGLAAVILACESLRRNDCGVALAGAVNLILSPDVMASLCRLRALAPDGRTKTFAAGADGYVRGEGAGVVVLKRYADAVAAGDRIHAVIRGWAMGQDGRTNGLTAPSGVAQRQVVTAARRHAGLTIDDIGYVEAHGTGTAFGDLIEAQALAKAFAGRVAPLPVGSVKPAIGHLEAAAGIAGLIKAVAMVRDAQIPAQIHCDPPNPDIDWESAPLEIVRASRDWSDAQRIAGISAFGFSGTNAHVIVAQPPHKDEAAPVDAERDGPALIVFSAATGASLIRRAHDLADMLEGRPKTDLHSFARQAAATLGGNKRTGAIVAATVAEAIAALRGRARDWSASGVPRPGLRPPRVCVAVSPTAAAALGAAFPALAGFLRDAASPDPAHRIRVALRYAGLGHARVDAMDLATLGAAPADIRIAVGFEQSANPQTAQAQDDVIHVPARGADPVRSGLEVVAMLAERGVMIDVMRVIGGGRSERQRFPAYPFERERFWFDDGI